MASAESQKLIQDIRSQKTVQVQQAISIISIAQVTEDESTQSSLLSMAQKQLMDESVLKTWLVMAIQLKPESSQNLIYKMLVSVFQITQKKSQASVFEVIKPCLPQLVGLLGWVDLQGIVLQILFQVLVYDESVLVPLIEAYEKTSDRHLQRYLAVNFLKRLSLYRSVSDFFIKYFAQFDPDIQAAAASELILMKKLSIAEQVILAQQGSEVVQYLLIGSWARSIGELSSEQISVLEKTAAQAADWRLRSTAIAVFRLKVLVNKELREKLKNIFKTETHTEVKSVYIDMMFDWITDQSETIDFLASFVADEKEQKIADTLLRGLRPYLGLQNESGLFLRKLWLQQMECSTDPDFLFERAQELSDVVQYNLSIIDELLYLYESIHNEQTRAAVLGILKYFISSSDQVRKLFESALKSSSKQIRQAVLQAALQMPIRASSQNFLLRTALQLATDTSFDESSRQKLLKKIVFWPSWDAEEARSLSEISKQIPTYWDVHKWLGKAQMSISSQRDWDGIKARLAASHSSENLLPQIYYDYQKMSGTGDARSILQVLKEIILSSSYLKRHQADSKEAILQFLEAHDQIDQDLAAYLVQFILQDQTSSLVPAYLAILKKNSLKSDLKKVATDLFAKVINKSNSTEVLLLFEILMPQYCNKTESLETGRLKIYTMATEQPQNAGTSKFISALKLKKDLAAPSVKNADQNSAGFLDD